MKINDRNNLKEAFIHKILKESEESIDDFFKPKNLKSREEKVEKKTKDIYFSFFDKMNEPERTQAKNNFVMDEAMLEGATPTTISNALRLGFVWGKTPEGLKYWDEIWEKYKLKSGGY